MERQVSIDLIRLKSAVSRNEKQVCIDLEQQYTIHLPKCSHFVQSFNPDIQRKDTLASTLIPTDIPEELFQ